MTAEFFSQTPQAAVAGRRRRTRQVHRWVAIVFTLAVAANFAAMPFGPPPPWITYAPLPPLLFLMLTGLFMLATTRAPSRRGDMQ